jgi:rod shape determining protein RodA
MNYPQSQEAGWSEFLARFHIDMWLGLLIIATASIGLAVVYSASGHSLAMLINQLERLGLGLLVMAICAQAPPEFYRRVAPFLYAGTLFLLVLVPILGESSKGAQRWLDLKVIRFQPSEIMKLAMPMAVAAFLHRRPLPPKAGTLIATLLIVLIPTVLVAAQPDLGTGMLIAVAGAFALFFGGLGWRWIAGGVAGVAAVAPLLWFKLHEYQRQRVLTFLDPERDPLGAGYHITQSKIAIGSGGLYGKGWMQGTQAKLDFLPESHTDFIFAVYSEELGLLGILLLLALYLAIVGRGLIIALRGQDTFQRLLGGSLALTFFIYMFINMGMVIGLLPVVGVPLPLISYGGTSMVTLLTGFGLLMSIQTHRKLISN